MSVQLTGIRGLYKPLAQAPDMHLPDNQLNLKSQFNMSSTQYTIPDLLVTWPWQRVLHPMLAEVKDEANVWVESLDLFEPAQLRKFNACDFSTWLDEHFLSS